ncbi:hypothetical protein G3I36_15450, partial [Streptomyces sp. SID10362]|nr:hypothetical protein [Streptomyces sp. SID10362]
MNGTNAMDVGGATRDVRDATRGRSGGGRPPRRGRRALIACGAGAAVLGGVLVL